MPLEEQIETFKRFLNITIDIPELNIVDTRLSGYWNEGIDPCITKEYK